MKQKEEFNLSEWIHTNFKNSQMNMIEDIWIKEFIKKLKEEIPKLKSEGYYDCCNDETFFELINKFAGKKLI